MYPYELFWGIDLYTLMITLGVVVCLLLIRLQGDMRGLRAKFQNDVLSLVPLAVLLGYGASVVVQAFYNMLDKGSFSIDSSTGATFYGGLIGGVVSFIAIYFIWGKIFFKDDDTYKKQFALVANVAPAAIIEAVRQEVIREQGANYIKSEEIPQIVDEKIPQQLLVSMYRKFNK